MKTDSQLTATPAMALAAGAPGRRFRRSEPGNRGVLAPLFSGWDRTGHSQNLHWMFPREEHLTMRTAHPLQAVPGEPVPPRSTTAASETAAPWSPPSLSGWAPLFGRMVLPTLLFGVSLFGLLPGGPLAHAGDPAALAQPAGPLPTLSRPEAARGIEVDPR